MKKVLFAAALCLAFAACSENKNVLLESDDVTIRVSDNGFSTEDGASAYAKTFSAGDRIGIFAVQGGSIVEGFNNLCVTATESRRFSWDIANSELQFPSNAEYYAYYPYNEGLTGNVNTSATSAAEFFSAIEAHWNVATSQSGNGYDNSNLLIGSAKVADGELSFQLSPCMGLVEVSLPGFIYKFLNLDYDIADYAVVNGSTTFTGTTPKAVNGKYLYIVKPGAFTVSGTLSGEPWEFSGTAETGRLLSYTEGESQIIEHNLQVGDFYLADGRLISKDADASEVASANVIGVVCQVNPDRIADAEREALGGTAHGLVLATQNCGPNGLYRFYSNYANQETFPDKFYYRDESEIGFPIVPEITDLESLYELAMEDNSGYYNTHLIYDLRTEDFEIGDYPGFLAVYNFSTQVGGPVDGVSTGWFMPAGGQMLDAIRNLAGLELKPEDARLGDWAGAMIWIGQGNVPEMMNERISKVSDNCKTIFPDFQGGTMIGSIASESAHRYMTLDANGYVEYLCNPKYTTTMVRPMLAF